MPVVTVSSKGQVVLPAPVRSRLGLGAGAKLELIDEPDGVRLKLIRSVQRSEVTALAGLVTAPSKGRKRHLGRFDPASVVPRRRR